MPPSDPWGHQSRPAPQGADHHPPTIRCPDRDGPSQRHGASSRTGGGKPADPRTQRQPLPAQRPPRREPAPSWGDRCPLGARPQLTSGRGRAGALALPPSPTPSADARRSTSPADRGRERRAEPRREAARAARREARRRRPLVIEPSAPSGARGSGLRASDARRGGRRHSAARGAATPPAPRGEGPQEIAKSDAPGTTRRERGPGARGALWGRFSRGEGVR